VLTITNERGDITTGVTMPWGVVDYELGAYLEGAGWITDGPRTYTADGWTQFLVPVAPLD
jgi:hypothetical protein